MQESRFFGKIDGLPKPPEGNFCHHQNHLEGKIRKGPPTTSLIYKSLNIGSTAIEDIIRYPSSSKAEATLKRSPLLTTVRIILEYHETNPLQIKKVSS